MTVPVDNRGGDSVPEDYAPSLACLFADGVVSLSFGPSVAKLYLSRFDSPPFGKSAVAIVPVAQVVMPIGGYCDTVRFLVERLGSVEGYDTEKKDALEEIKRLCNVFLEA